VVDGFVLKSDDLGEAKPDEDLHVEDFFDSGLKLQQADTSDLLLADVKLDSSVSRPLLNKIEGARAVA
jgi:hypothetical protein